MSRTRKSGCRCRHGFGCKADPPPRLVKHVKQYGKRREIREVLRVLQNFVFKIPRGEW